MGKGSSPRPCDSDRYARGYERIVWKKTKKGASK